MIFTRLAWLIGLALLATMCWLAIAGLSIVVPLLVTGLMLVVLVGGGNLIGGRSPSASHRSRAERDPPPGGEG